MIVKTRGRLLNLKSVVTTPESTEDGLERCFGYNAEIDCVRLMEVFLCSANRGYDSAQKYAAELIAYRALQGKRPSADRPDSYNAYSAAIKGDMKETTAAFKSLSDEWAQKAIPHNSPLYPHAVHNSLLRDTSKVLRSYHRRWLEDDKKIAKMRDLARHGYCIDLFERVRSSPECHALFQGENLRERIERRSGKKFSQYYTPPCFTPIQDNVLQFKARRA